MRRKTEGTFKKKKFDPLNLVLVALLVMLLFTVVKIWIPLFQTTSFYKQMYTTYQNHTWVTFTSKRAKFSFIHPLSWPVTPASDKELKENNVFGIGDYTSEEIENIDFGEEWIRNAGANRFGYIVVQETDSKNLKEYVNELTKEKVVDMYIKGGSQKVTIPPPNIEYLTIGAEEAISVTDSNTGARFSREMRDYRLIRNGWLYRFVTVNSSRFLENSEKNSETFQKMISSVKFSN